MKKKIVSILLACCMTFGGSISAMAAEPNQNVVEDQQTVNHIEDLQNDEDKNTDNLSDGNKNVQNGTVQEQTTVDDENGSKEPEVTPGTDGNPDGNTDGNPEVKPEEPKKEIQLKPGWNKVDGDWYYGDANGKAKSGWIKLKNIWYYLMNEEECPETPGKMVASQEYTVKGLVYLFDNNGGMQTGWVSNNGWYYYNASGAKQTDWIKLKNLWYYLNPADNGKMSGTGWNLINGKWYYMNKSGAMLTGWIKTGGKWYYLTGSGAMATGWAKVNGKWYYLKEKGAMATGWVLDKETWYFTDGNGAMATGWVKTGGRWYYMNKSGAMQTGWLAQGQNWYYLYKKNDSHGSPEGAMASNTVIDGWVVAPDGIYNTAYQNAYKVLNQVGWNLRAAYNWSAGLKYYRMQSSPSQGSTYFANFGFTKKTGNCYVMAATFCHMARLLGYDAHQIAGYVPRKGGGVTPHSWCELTIGKTKYVFDPNFTNETGRNGYQITYGTSGTWMYSNYHRMN